MARLNPPGVRSLGVCSLGLLMLVLLGGCQLVDPAEQAATGVVDTERGGADPDDLLGNPEDEWPETLVGILALVRPDAFVWQDQPVLADLTVYFEAPGIATADPPATPPPAARAPGWERVRLTYVAADADRMLTIRAAEGEALRIQRPRLAGLSLPELPPEAIEVMRPLPADVLEPRDLAVAARMALADCGADGEPVLAVLYATGAPAGWDPTAGRWSPLPTWRATVVTTTVGVSVDPTDGTAFAPLTCVDPVLLEEE